MLGVKLRQVLVIAFLFWGLVGFAGDSSSGGGKILRDERNPWFVQNTKVVEYCVDIDPNLFGQSEDVATRQIERAIQYWKEEFSHAAAPAPGGPFSVATQEFRKVACHGNGDIVFALGKLTPAQAKLIGKPRDFISAAVRTHYDRAQLRARGFIYVSPAAGPLQPSAADLLANPWQVHDGELLFRVLVHEMGHVFGLSHKGSAAFNLSEDSGVMSADFPEVVLKRATAELMARSPMPGFFHSRKHGYSVCGTAPAPYRELFSIPPFARCFSIEYKENLLQVYIRRAGEKDWEIIGFAPLQRTAQRRFSEAVSVWLPDEQKLVSLPASGPFSRLLPVALIAAESKRGSYRARDAAVPAREILVDVPPSAGMGRITAVIAGKLVALDF